MKQITLIVICLMLMFTVPITANGNLPTKTPATKENLLEDAVIDLLRRQLFSAAEDYYGDTKDFSFSCVKVVNIKKLHHPGSMLFEVNLEGVSFEGAHNYLDIFSVTIKKDWETEGNWVMQNYKVRKFIQNEKFECRDTA
jgi:hypothetical protein